MPSALGRRGTVSTATRTFDFWGIMRSSLEAVIAVMLCIPSGWVLAQTQPPDQSSFTTLRSMAESGDVEAQSKLGAMYMSGDGVQKNLATGFRWSYRAALGGSATAARMVSNAYSSGLGVPQDQAAAFDWARIAATRADPGSQGAMIVYYSKGLGVAKDLTMAFAWAVVLRDYAAKRSSAYLISLLTSLELELLEDQKSEAHFLATSWEKNKDHVMPVHSQWYLDHIQRERGAETIPQSVPQPKGCSSGHWLSDKMDDGKYIKLEDDSLWEVDSVDTVDSELWLETDDITVCPGKLINTDEKETVGAKRIK